MPEKEPGGLWLTHWQWLLDSISDPQTRKFYSKKLFDQSTIIKNGLTMGTLLTFSSSQLLRQINKTTQEAAAQDAREKSALAAA